MSAAASAATRGLRAQIACEVMHRTCLSRHSDEDGAVPLTAAGAWSGQHPRRLTDYCDDAIIIV
jgi:hypothetical protein